MKPITANDEIMQIFMTFWYPVMICKISAAAARRSETKLFIYLKTEY
jgi:hypothetical protein